MKQIIKNKYQEKYNNLYLKFTLCMCFLLFTISLFTQNSISKAQISEDKLGVIYEMSLNTICGMNIDKLQVSIGNIYNVIDMDGNLEGYSLGYFVGDIPYGYAIYSIKNNCIQVFPKQNYRRD